MRTTKQYDSLRRLASLALCAGSVIALTGCANFWGETSTPAKDKAAKATLEPTPAKVVVDGPALALGQPAQGHEQRQKFLERFSTLITEQRPAAARIWVHKHPDLALDVLRDALYEPGDAQQLTALAGFYDEHCGVVTGRGWQACLAAANAGTNAWKSVREARAKLHLHLRNGEFPQASQIDLPGLARRQQQPMLEIDALQITGIAQMVAGDLPRATASLDQAARLATPIAPHQAAHALLLLSEARRRAGDNAGANHAWADAVTVGSDLLMAQRPLCDPTFWDRALYLQPVGIQWPAAAIDRLAALPRHATLPAALRPMRPIVQCSYSPATTLAPPAAVSACIGLWRLERGEIQPAIIALKRAESGAPTPEMAAWCRLGQARALCAMQQTAAASSALMQLAGSNEITPVTLAAMAELGSLKVRLGQTHPGIALLKRALETHPESDWPGRFSAEADLGLALLLIGEERAGLAALESARRGFEASGDHEAVAQCLWNEARYCEQTKNKQRLAELNARHRQMQF